MPPVYRFRDPCKPAAERGPFAGCASRSAPRPRRAGVSTRARTHEESAVCRTKPAPATPGVDQGPYANYQIPVAGFQGTPEEVDRQWFEKCYKGRGDTLLQLTWRAVIMGSVLGGVLSVTNIYIGLKAGWSFGVAITACILSYAIWTALRAVSGGILVWVSAGIAFVGVLAITSILVSLKYLTLVQAEVPTPIAIAPASASANASIPAIRRSFIVFSHLGAPSVAANPHVSQPGTVRAEDRRREERNEGPGDPGLFAKPQAARRAACGFAEPSSIPAPPVFHCLRSSPLRVPASSRPRVSASPRLRVPASSCPRVPASPCPRVSVSPRLRVPASPCPRVSVSPRLSASPRLRVSASPCPRVPASPRPRVSVSPRLRVPASPRPRVFVSPRPRVSVSPRPRVPASSSPRLFPVRQEQPERGHAPGLRDHRPSSMAMAKWLSTNVYRQAKLSRRLREGRLRHAVALAALVRALDLLAGGHLAEVAVAAVVQRRVDARGRRGR